MPVRPLFNQTANLIDAALAASDEARSYPDRADGNTAAPGKSRRPSPFSLRLSADERTRLLRDAGDVPLGSYIKAKLFDSTAPRRRTGLSVHDRAALAQALALLGRSHLASNLNQLAHAVNIGILPVTPETEAELLAAVQDVRDIRRLLLTALGKMEAAP
jgi:hypothetical protein